MNKKIISLVIFVALFCLVCPALGQVTIPNYGPASFPALLSKIAGAVTGLVGTIGTIMIIVAGILYLTSAGSPERIGTAKKALTYAIIGMAIGLGASAIIEIVGQIVK